jgi:hypothetical protein
MRGPGLQGAMGMVSLAVNPILAFQAGRSLLTDCAESETIGGTSELFVGRLLHACCGVQVYVYFLLDTIPLVPNPLLPNAIHWGEFCYEVPRTLPSGSLLCSSC